MESNHCTLDDYETFKQKNKPKIVWDDFLRAVLHNYLLYEHLLQVQLIPPERVHPKLWKGVNRYYKPVDWVQIERKRQNKERTFEEHKKLVDGILKREQKRRKKIEDAGIEYECPEIVGSEVTAPKKIRFED